MSRYAAHLGRPENHDSTLLCKFYGLFSIRIFFQTIYFTVMENVMPTGKGEIELEYDLKGSFIARNAKKPRRGKLATCRHCGASYKVGDERARGNPCNSTFRGHAPKACLKDNDLNHEIVLPRALSRALRTQIRRDVGFLCDMGPSSTNHQLFYGHIFTSF